MKNFIILLFVSIVLNLPGANYTGEIFSFRQPDGSKVDVKLFGNELYMRAEGLDGYTVVRDKSSGWICYASLSADGKTLVPTDIVYLGVSGNSGTLMTGMPFPLHIDISPDVIEEKISEKKKILGYDKISGSNLKTTPHTVAGNYKGLCIVVDFSDEPGTAPINEFTDFCNNMAYSNYSNNGSLRKYFYDVSGGLVDYENVVFGYYRAPLTFQEYEQMPYAYGAQQILGLALNWIESLGFDFSTLTTEPDGSITAINLMYTGVAQTWAEGMWWHMGWYSGFSADGVHSAVYNCSPAYEPLRISTVCHENGHMLGKWPDTYKYNSDTGPNGIGSFDLMCSTGSSVNPVPPNPHFRSNAGWGRVVDVTNYNGPNSDTANSLTCYKYVNINDTNEFFLIENRLKTGRSTFIPDQGLTIWHIDRMGDNQTTHHEVFLEHANNDITDHYDACFHSGFNNEFGFATVPGSGLYNNDPSGLRVWNIGTTGNIMNYNLGAGSPSPSLYLQFISISEDDNLNGYLEPGESANLNITAGNNGQIISGNITVTCSVIAGSSYVTVINPVYSGASLSVQQTIPVVFDVTLSSSTPLGTLLTFRFNISDGNDSIYITRNVIAGNQIIMSQQSVTTCNALFWDSGGGFAGYSNDEYSVLTIFPETQGAHIIATFNEFNVEFEENCFWDNLKIYNGASTASPSLGTYCGNNSPGIATSTDVSGALTFEFYSDGFVTGSGWQAVISCDAGSNTPVTPDELTVSIFPNPSRGVFNISTGYSGNSLIIISDVFGNDVMNSETGKTGSFSIDLSEYASGIYFIRIFDGKTVYYGKMIRK